MRTSTLIYVEVMLLYDTTALLQTFFCCGLEEEGEIPTILFALLPDFLGLWHQPSITLSYITPLPIDPDIIHVCWVHLKISIF